VLFGAFVFLIFQATALTLLGVFGAQTSIVAPWEDNLRVRRPRTHDRKDMSRVVAVELVMVNLADRVKRDQRGNVQVACQQQKELVVRTKGGQDTERLFGFVSRG
jgi:hypothetical protein